MEYRGNFIDGEWAPCGEPDGEITRENPSRTGETVFQAPWCTSAVEEATKSARLALPEWDRLGVEGRRPYLERLSQAFDRCEDEIARQIAREVGKPLWEARGEAAALSAKIDIMSGEGMEQVRSVSPEGLEGGSYRPRPLGVLGVLGPFNFPLHLPNGHIVPALLTGNTVVVKPSEIAPGCMQIYFECLESAGFPDGVVNMVHGPGEVGAAVAESDAVNGVLFTGSWETGMRIKEATSRHYWKQLALEMGGKNTSIVLDDADIEQAVHQIAYAAYMTTGQRCSATSRVVVRKEIAVEFIDAFKAMTERVTTGDALDEEAFMGPLATKSAYEDFLAAQDDNEGSRLDPIVEGGDAGDDLDGYFVKPAVWLANEVNATGSHQGRELFGPDVVIYVVDSDKAAAHVANATEFGLAMSVFTEDRERFDEIGYDLKAGVLNMNRSTCGASSRLPFGGVKKSGNGRPSALLAAQYCTYPQAQLVEPAGFDEEAAGEKPFSLLGE